MCIKDSQLELEMSAHQSSSFTPKEMGCIPRKHLHTSSWRATTGPEVDCLTIVPQNGNGHHTSHAHCHHRSSSQTIGKPLYFKAAQSACFGSCQNSCTCYPVGRLSTYHTHPRGIMYASVCIQPYQLCRRCSTARCVRRVRNFFPTSISVFGIFSQRHRYPRTLGAAAGLSVFRPPRFYFIFAPRAR